jgi:hypothetical protein
MYYIYFKIFNIFQDLGVKSPLFKHASNVYSMDLIIGDSLLKKPIVWNFGDIKLKFLENESVPSESFAEYYLPKKLISVSIDYLNIIIKLCCIIIY